MSSKERFLRAFNYEKPDRVPIDYGANPGIDARLKAYFNLKKDDDEGLCKALGVDFRWLNAKYNGVPLHTTDRNDRMANPLFGWVTRYIEHESGGYWDHCDFPLIDADEEAAVNWPFPNPDDCDYNGLLEQAKANKDYALCIGESGIGCVIELIGYLQGMEQVLVGLMTDDPATLVLVKKLMHFQLGYMERSLDKAGKDADVMWIGEDLGTQRAPLISMEMFRKHILPWHKKLIDLAASYSLPVFIHSCGSSSWAYEDYIKAGLKGVNPLQPEAASMDPRYLKDTFGGRLFFHGGISTAGPIAFGTVDETIRNCKEILDIMKPGYGYCFSPTHLIQDNSPTENVVAAYETAHSYGRYT